MEFLGLRGFGFLDCAGGKFGAVAGVFFAEKHSPDAECGGTGRWPQCPVCLTLLGLSTGRGLSASDGVHPV